MQDQSPQTYTPLNDSGIAINESIEVVDTDDEQNIEEIEHHTEEPEDITVPEKQTMALSEEQGVTVSEEQVMAAVWKQDMAVAEEQDIAETEEQCIAVLKVQDTADPKGKDNAVTKNPVSKSNYKKPNRPCPLCPDNKEQSRLKRHILTKHSKHPSVSPLLQLSPKEQDREIENLRSQGIWKHNMKIIKEGGKKFMRERSQSNQDVPVMCAGCKKFIAKSYKSRHQLVCRQDGLNPLVPVVEIEKAESLNEYSEGFKSLLNTLHLDLVGNFAKSDPIILMVGARSHTAIKRKQDKVNENMRTVRSRMRLMSRVYLAYREIYQDQSNVVIQDLSNDSSDMYRREGISILALAAEKLSEKDTKEDYNNNGAVLNQKSGLKVSILNMIKLTGKYIIGHYLMKNEDKRADYVVMFLKVLKGFENDLFGDAYYDIANRRNSTLRKPINLPKEDDVKMLLDECNLIMGQCQLDFPDPNCYVNMRSATLTSLIIFNARRGGEPSRLSIKQWEEAMRGEWIDSCDLPSDFESGSSLITFQTGKGKNHLVSVIFPSETLNAVKFLADPKIRQNAGVLATNYFLFPSTQHGKGHADGWHSINDILKKLSLKGAINATRNRHRVASLLAKLSLTQKEKDLIYTHFGHSEEINQGVYQAAGGSQQLNITGNYLTQIHNNAKVKLLLS